VSVFLRSDAAGQTGTAYFDGFQAVKAASLPNIYSQGQSIKNSFDQRTTAAQPVLTPAVFRGKPGVKLDGSDDALRGILGAYLTGTNGLVMAFVRLGTATGANERLFAQSDEASTTRVVEMIGRRATQVNLMLNYDNGGVGSLTIRGSTALVAGKLYLDIWRSDDSALSLRLNGRQEALTLLAGSNNGQWFGDSSALDNSYIGATKTSGGEGSYFSATLIALLIFSSDPGMGSRMKQLERMVRQRGLRALR